MTDASHLEQLGENPFQMTVARAPALVNAVAQLYGKNLQGKWDWVEEFVNYSDHQRCPYAPMARRPIG